MLLQNIHNSALLINGDMSSSLVSYIMNMDKINFVSIQAVFTGTPVGVLKIKIQTGLSSTYSDYTGSSQIVNGAGDVTWTISDISFTNLQVAYTYASGSGVLNIFSSGKQF